MTCRRFNWLLVLIGLLAAIIWSIVVLRIASAQSLSDIVKESEGGTMPTEKDFNARQPQKEGESHLGRPPADPGPLRSAWGFVAWTPDGQLYRRAGGLFEGADECAQARAARHAEAPGLTLSACILLESGERERL